MNKNQFYSPKTLYPLLSFLIPFLIYIYTLCPTVYIEDSGDMISAAYILGIPHQPGYPLYCLLGRVFAMIIPIANIAYRINLMSAFFAAGTALLLYFINLKLFRSRYVAILAAFFFAFSTTFWSQATIARVYALHVFLLALLTLILLHWDETKHIKWILAFSFLLGLGMGNHLGLVIAVPMVLILVEDRQWLLNLEKLGSATFAFLLGISVYLYLPVRSHLNPMIDTGNPESFQALLAVISRQQFWVRKFIHSITDVFLAAKNLALSIPSEFSIAGTFLILAGIYFLYLRKRSLLWPLISVIAGNFLLMIVHGSREDILIWRRYFLPIYFILSVFFAAGIYFICERIKMLNKRPFKWIYYSCILGIILWNTALNFTSNNRRNQYIAYDYGCNILKSVDENSILFVEGINETFILGYLKLVENMRPDVTVIDRNANYFGDKYHYPIQSTIEQIEKIQMQREREIIKSTVQPVYYDSRNRTASEISEKLKPVGLVYRYYRENSSAKSQEKIWSNFELRSLVAGGPNEEYIAREIRAMYEVHRGEWFVEDRNINRAKILLRQASKIAFDSRYIFNILGSIYENENWLDLAGRTFQRAIEIDPYSVDDLIRLGNIFRKQGKFSEAMNQYRTALKYRTGDVSLWINIALLEQEFGRIPEAVRLLHQAIQFGNPSATTYYNLANMLRAQGKIDSALFYYEKSIRLNNNLSYVWAELGITFQGMNQFDKASNCFQRGIEIDPQNARAHYYYGNWHLLQKHWQDAEQFYLKTIQLDSTFVDVWINLGNSYINQERLGEAEECYHQALKLNPRLSQPYENLGNVNYLLGEIKVAVSYWKKALEIDPNNSRLKQTLKNLGIDID